MKSKKWRIAELVLITLLIGTLFLPWLGASNAMNDSLNFNITTAIIYLRIIIAAFIRRWDNVMNNPILLIIPVKMSICTILFFTIGVLLLLTGVFTYLSGKNRKYIKRRDNLMKCSKILIVLQLIAACSLSIFYSLMGGTYLSLRWQLLLPCVLMITEKYIKRKLMDEEEKEYWRAKENLRADH